MNVFRSCAPCRERGSNPHVPRGTEDFKSPASTDFAIPASPSRGEFRPPQDPETHTERAGPGASGQAKWRRRRADSNRRIEVLQTSALATWLRRLDPRTAGAVHGIRTRDFNLGKVALYH